MTDAILTLNAGSSSLKFGLFRARDLSVAEVRGQVERLGHGAELEIKTADGERQSDTIGDADHARALQCILDHLKPLLSELRVIGVGHRIAHGGLAFVGPCRLDETSIAQLRTLEPMAPLHQPHNLTALEAAQRIFPGAAQIGCFDTAFHRGHPWVNDTFALPRRYYDAGVRRYGFHGLSYTSVSRQLAESDPGLGKGRVVITHLGNGASMCGIADGKSVASTMGYSALDGLAMGTRCGQLDPGVVLHLIENEKMSAPDVSELLYKESGLKGLSGISHDMRTLEASDRVEAREAIDYFVFRIRREVGAMAAVLGGLDALVFCGGIGENSAMVRASVCDGLQWMGIEIDPERNAGNDRLISSGALPVLVIPTDEEQVIAEAVGTVLMTE